MHDLQRTGATGMLLLCATLALATPSFAQIDLTGEWAGRPHEDALARGAGPEIGDYTGLPLNDAGRLKAESWEAGILSTRERQCIPHVVTYAMRGPANLRMWKETDPLTGQIIAYRIYGTYGRPRTIWLDGRPHPSEFAPHTWAGFSTGRWEGNKLTVTTTHIKTGWIQRNGAATSDLATMTEHFIRHGDLMTVVSIVNDPVYLSEPFIRTSSWVLALNQQLNSFGACGPAGDEVAVPRGYVSHHLPGTNDQVKAFLKDHAVPSEGAAGGADTTYPEYLQRILQPGTPRPAVGLSPNQPVRRQPSSTGDIEVLRVQGNVYLLAGDGGNIAAAVGDDGVLLVDTGAGKLSDKVIAAVKRLSDKPIHYILNTGADPDHVGGNEALAKAGRRIGTQMVAAALAGEAAAILSHEKVLNTMSAPSGKQAPTPFAAQPTDTYFTDVRNLFFDGEAIQMLHQPAAHSDGDSVVFFRRSDVIVTGDVFDLVSYPVIDAQRGGSLKGLIDAANRIVDLAIVRDWQEGGTMIIPGHGRIADQADMVEYRDMLTIVRDRVQDLIKKGMTLAQVKAARPTLDYDGRYGSPDAFIEAAYRELSARR
jgi:glyoxylase-like metal-dependent hydrolase (beta-lactamase superfamily II)